MNNLQKLWVGFWVSISLILLTVTAVTNESVRRVLFIFGFFFGVPFGLTGLICFIVYVFMLLGDDKRDEEPQDLAGEGYL